MELTSNMRSEMGSRDGFVQTVRAVVHLPAVSRGSAVLCLLMSVHCLLAVPTGVSARLVELRSNKKIQGHLVTHES